MEVKYDTMVILQSILLLFLLNFEGKAQDLSVQAATTYNIYSRREGDLASPTIAQDEPLPQQSENTNCRLSENWAGSWFQLGIQQPILINATIMETKGTCHAKKDDKYLFFKLDNGRNCYMCVVINRRHDNVLQYKENSFCEEKEPRVLDELCETIPGDAPLYSLFRLDAKPVPCPFTGGSFTYNRGQGECWNPVSHLDTCTVNSRLLLRYQACPDVSNTESTAEELHCIATWQEGSHRYLIGKIFQRHLPSMEEMYRCFAYVPHYDSHKNGTGYKVAISGDASCSGVSSPTEGSRMLTIYNAESSGGKCSFPGWFASRRWHTLDGKLSLQWKKNGTFHVESETTSQRNEPVLPHYSLSLESSPRLSVGTRVMCHSVKEFSDRHVAVVAERLLGCKRERMCMHIFRRDHHVIEIQMRPMSSSEDFACLERHALSASNSGDIHPFLTLVSADSKSHRRCPYLGTYSASGVTQDGRVARDSCGSTSIHSANFKTLVVGCGNRATMEFHSSCPNQEEQSMAFLCDGSWADKNHGFLIASPISMSSANKRRYCFIYTTSQEGNLQVLSSSETCLREPRLEGTWAFNLTIQGQCAEAMTAGASSWSVIQLLAVSSTLFARTMSFLLFAFSSQ